MKLLSTVLAGVLTTVAPPEPPSDGMAMLDGTLKVITRASPSTYYVGSDGPQGLEYELARRFASERGLELEIETAGSPTAILAALENGSAQIAAPGIHLSPAMTNGVRFGPGYERVKQLLVYRHGATKPQSPADLYGNVIDVVAGTNHIATLEDLRRENPWIQWRVNPYGDSMDLLESVWRHEVSFAIADAQEIARTQRVFPELRAAFELGEPQPLAWAFSRHTDAALYTAALRFFEKMHRTGELERLVERYHYESNESFDYVEARRLLRHIDGRLPAFQHHFERAGERYGADWRLLAAIGYQESHWKVDAVSPTGVKGIMMLTTATAKQLGVTDRTDPTQSIAGGARYFARIKSRLPETVLEPDRTWMALAAYNVGLGHLEDARTLTAGNAGNPNRWRDVRDFLLRLREKKWYAQTRYGFARGHEGATYVRNIRRYYDTMVVLDSMKTGPLSDLYATF